MDKTKIGGIIPTPLRQELYMAVDIKRLDGLGDLEWTWSPLSST